MIYRTPEKINIENYKQITSDLKRLLESGEDVYLDFANTKYITSDGLRILIIGLKTFRNKNYDFAVINANPQIEEIIVKTGLEQVLLQKDIEKVKR